MVRLSTTSLSFVAALLATSLAQTISSVVVSLDNVDYFLPPKSSWSLKTNEKPVDNIIVPVTVVHSTSVSAQSIRAAFETYNKTDDVWSPSFTKKVLVVSNSSSTIQPKDLAPYSVDSIYYSSQNYTKDVPAPGPYFLDTVTGSVFRAYGLFPDTNQAFIQATYQTPDGSHTNLRASGVSAGGLTIAVPSRLFYTPTKEKPLAGVRLAVKDLYDLKGVKTSSGNRAQFAQVAPANKTAAAVQKLIDAGAVVVGKNKLSEFAFGGQYHLDHIDYLLPFNPRGDGYNTPGDSSGGSGASVASYDWLDASMGSDTGGSIRGPALANGVHGNRPSQDAVSLEGALPLSHAMDTSGILTRDPELWSTVNKALYAGFAKEYTQFPTSVYLAADFNLTILAQAVKEGDKGAVIVSAFLEGLSKVLGNATIDNVSLDSAFNATAPHGAAGNRTLASIVNNVYGNLTTYEQWNLFGRDYLNRYRATHNGEYPYMVPSTLDGWLRANATITEAIHTNDLAYKKAVVDFASNDVFLADEKTCSDSILLYFSSGSKFYKPDFDPVGQLGSLSSHDANPFVQEVFEERDELYSEVLELQETISQLNGTNSASSSKGGSSASTSSGATTSPGRFASLAGLPDYAITIGSFVDESNFSNKTQKVQTLPYGVDIVTRHGCDFMLQNLISQLYEQKVIKHVNTGSLI